MTPEITIDADAVPDELKNRDQWLMWDAAADTPRRPHWRGNFHVSWTDPDDWHSFEEAHQAMQDRESWGIGYVFALGNEDYPRGLYSALDLDGCVNDRGGPKDWLPSLEPFNGETYMEYSPSGEGIHIPLVGIEAPEWWANAHFDENEHEGVELYEKKFFTFTGDEVETSAGDIGDLGKDAVYDWLARAYEAITGDDPREVNQQSAADSEPRETKKSREELADVETTTDYDDVLDAVDHLEPADLPLRSSYVEDENTTYESWDPAYRQSRSGKSLKRHKQSGIFFDMSNGDTDGYDGFGVLELYAAEEGLVHRPWDKLAGDDFKEAVKRARESGAPIPEFVGGGGDLPEEAKKVEPSGLDAETAWNFWSDARLSGELDETAVIPELPLWHIAREHTSYDLDSLSDDAEELPPKAHNRALYWLENFWPEDANLGLADDEEVTARSYRRRDSAVYTWEDVRYIYDGSDGQPDKQGGRFAAVQLLRSKYHFATPEDTERLHIYEEDVGVYERTAELIVDRELDASLGRHYSQHEKNEILGRIKAGTYRPREDFEAGTKPGQYLCVENGVIDLDNRELLDHDPEYLFTAYLPVEYDEDAEATRIREFLGEITRREDDELTMLEMLGNCFLPNYDYESFLVLFGEGANGKSTWLSVVRSLLGRDNVTSMTLQTLSDNRFAASNLLGKLANIGEDLPEKKIKDVGTLKDLTGGGETWVEEKGKQGFDMENRAKLMFAANRPPVLGEKSEAVKRRLLPIRLPFQFVPDPDPDDDRQKKAVKEGLVDELTTDEELSGLLNMALDGLDRLRADGDFSMPETNDERLAYYEQFSDPIKEFAINCLENTEGRRVKKSIVYNAYTNFCAANDYESSSRNVFWREFRQTVLNVATVRPKADGPDGTRHEYVDNMAFTEPGATYIPADETAPVVGEDPEAAANQYGDVTPLTRLQQGDLATVTAELKQTYTPDTTKQWFDLEGWLVDSTGAAKIVVREHDEYGLEEGGVYRLQNVNVSLDDGVAAVEVVPNLSSVSEIELGEGSTDPDGAAWLTEATKPDTADARADGGSGAASSTSEGMGPPADAEGQRADAQRLAVIASTNGPLAKGRALSLGMEHYDMSPDRAEAAFDYAVENDILVRDHTSEDERYVNNT